MSQNISSWLVAASLDMCSVHYFMRMPLMDISNLNFLLTTGSQNFSFISDLLTFFT